MFYTYIHRRNDTSQVFYVGKGLKTRPWKKAGRSDLWTRIMEKYGLTVEIVSAWPSDKEAILHEILLISIFRDLGHPLVNFTDGGEGTAGHSPDAKTRILLSESQSAYLNDPKRRQERGDRLRKVWEDPAKRSAMIARIRSNHADPEWSLNRGSAIRQGHAAAGVSAAMSKRYTGYWADPIYRAKMSKQVVCLDSGVMFKSAQDAADQMGLKRQTISDVCRGGRCKTAGGFKFAYPSIDSTPCSTPL